MNINHNCKKTFTVIILLLVIIGLAFPPNISAKFQISNDDGVAFDIFDNDVSITLENCSLKNRVIRLNFEPINVTYNHKNKPNKIEAYRIKDTLITPGEGDFLQLLSKFINPNLIPGEEFNSTQYVNIDHENEGKSAQTQSVWWRYLNYTSHPMNLFRFTIDEEIDLIEKFWVGWQTKDYDKTANVKKITMYIWSYGDQIPRWNFIHSIKYDENITYPQGYIGDEVSSEKYISEEGGIDILIIATPTNGTGNVHTSKLWSDYIEVKINIEEGYESEGFVFSDFIEPQISKFKGWESIIWEGSEPNENTNVKIQVLDKDNNIIESLDGNSDGFSTSPIDLSSLDVENKKIKLKATLNSKNPQHTPKLNSWGVLWRTIDGFYDNFTYTYRIGDSVGIEIEENQTKISSYYSEWPIFGKNPGNTRSYIGPDPNDEDNETYWTTQIDEDYGGWFRSPVMSNGKIYISSKNRAILAFNLMREKNKRIQVPIDSSYRQYYVESSLAVGKNSKDEELVIAATSALNNTENMVYALDAGDLKTEKWNSTINNPDSTMCFSSSPVIAGNNVYVTSWSGKFSYAPQLYYIYSKINSILNNAFNLNNYLHGFNLDDGKDIKGYPILLPAGSLSAPAVDDGVIYVGCENTQGPSLLAYDESSGNLLWNVSVGMIGRSSPVIAESDDGKIVFVLSREQNILSFSGEDKVYALRAETGEMLWNKTIGNDSIFLRTTLLKGLDFENLIATSEPASTPAVSGNTVFIMAPNGTMLALDVETGEEIWTFSVKQRIGGTLSSYYCSSPAVVGNTVYIGSQDGNVYAINSSNGNLRFQYPIDFEGIRFPLLLYFYSAPIVTDGLVVISATELLPIGSVNLGHLICLGNYQTNNVGEIYSTPIHVQKGKWWNLFNATYDNSTNSRVSFNILDSEGNILMEDLNGSDNKISDSNIINTGVIQLYAKLNTTAETSILNNWTVTFSSETVAPIFNDSTFLPDPGGWINSNKPVCTIKVYDKHPGLDVFSARYQLIYKDDEKSDWYDAECTGINGTKINQTITADVSKIEPAKEIKRIKISIKDLAGNRAIYELTEDFTLDTEKPTSFIESNLSSQYNEPFRIIANASDSGENKSGVKTISLYYKLDGQENWTQYGSSESPYEWDFDIEISGLYEISTIATDRAGNVEDFPDEIENSFVYDKIPPAKPNLEELYHFAKLPELLIEFIDDFLLKDVEYRLSFRGEWVKINNEDINSNSYTGKWTLKEPDWEYMEDDKIYFIYFRITDAAGNQYQTAIDNDALAIIKDTIPPGSKVDLDLSDLEGGGWKDNYIITAYIPFDEDIDYVTLEYRYSPDDDKWSNWKQYGKSLNRSVYEWEFSPDEGSGYYEFKVKLWDYAGNNVESIPGKVSLTLLQTNQLILIIALFIIFIIFTRYITVKMIKKKD